MAIRRSPDFRFDYYLRSLHTDVIGKRCEQLMKAAEKEVEQIAKKFQKDAQVSGENIKAEINTSQVDLPKFKAMKEIQRKQEEDAIEGERKQLEVKVEDIENNMEAIQTRLKFLQKCSAQIDGSSRRSYQQQAEFPDDLLPDLVNLVAKSGSSGVTSIANEFISDHGQVCSKKSLSAKIEDVAKKERRKEDGDKRPVWYILPEYMNMLSVSTLRHLRTEKDARLDKDLSNKKRKKDANGKDIKGAIGPDGEFVDFPVYDGKEPPRDCKKAFTLFCAATRKEVKKSLDSASRKDRVSMISSKNIANFPSDKNLTRLMLFHGRKR